MKTIDQVLKGVTARGKWEADDYNLTFRNGEYRVARFTHRVPKTAQQDAAFAARAAANFEGLVKALQECERLFEAYQILAIGPAVAARRALTEALKD